MKKYSTKQAAEKLGLHYGTVQRLCGIHGIGTLINKTTRVLTDDDVKKLAALKKEPGNPAFQKRAKRKKK